MRQKTGIDLERLKIYMAVPAIEKLRSLARRQAFNAKLMTPQRQAVSDELRARGF
ncbi:MAG: hypothetical protein HQL20_02765 [Candidatus Omnitrophica bacterium]|nr:hypothetical protein [Candidatus Omnitrophota bacterium]